MQTFKQFLKEDATEGAILEEIIVAVWNGETPPPAKSIHPEAGRKIVDYLKSKGIKGAKAQKLVTSGINVTSDWSEFWKPDSVPGSTKTPKTDIIIGNNRISLKMGDSQLMSGGKNESRATFYAAASKMKSLDDELLEPIWVKLNNLAKSSLTQGKVDAAIKSGSDPIVTEANKVNNEVKELMKSLFANNKEFRRNFVREAMTGEVKFGPTSKAYAEYVLSSDHNGNTPALHDVDNNTFLDKVASKTTVTVRFKSTSEKSKGQKTGQYRYWSVVSLIVNKLQEEFSAHEGSMLTEGIISNIWNKVKQFAITLFNKIYEFLKKSVKNIIDFFDLEPVITFNNIIDFGV